MPKFFSKFWWRGSRERSLGNYLDIWFPKRRANLSVSGRKRRCESSKVKDEVIELDRDVDGDCLNLRRICIRLS